MAPFPPWSDLNQDLLIYIATLLPTNPLNTLAFRSVCKSWNSAIPPTLSPNLSPHLPLITPPPPFELCGRSDIDSCVLTPTVVYSFRPPENYPHFGSSIWLCFIDQFNKHSVSFRFPFSKKSFSLPDDFPKALNLLDFSAFELGRFYNLCYDYPAGDISVKPLSWSEKPVKVVLLSDMSAILVLYRDGKLGLIRLGLGVGAGELMVTSNWIILHDGTGFHFDDIVEFEGRVLGVDRRGRVYIIGLHEPNTFDQILPPIAGGGGRRKRLVESLGKLYLAVICNIRSNAAFKVYHFVDVKKKKKWGQVAEFGDRVFFFGVDFSLSFSTQQLGGVCKKNSIFYTQRSFWNYSGKLDDAWMFCCLEPSELDIGVCHLEDAARVGLIGLYPSYCKLLWPPPSWIIPFNKLESHEIVEAANQAAIDDVNMMVPDGLKHKDRLDEAESFVELDRIIRKESAEVAEQNMEIVKGHIRTDEMQKQLLKFHQYRSSHGSSSHSSSSQDSF